MGAMDPTPHVGMFNRVSNLEEVILTNVGINVNFICRLSFESDPIHMWHGLLFEQLPNTRRMGLPFPTHPQNKNKKNNYKPQKQY
jgi:hypothetical protein